MSTNQKPAYDFSLLPTEIWAGIVKSLESADLRSCLSVSGLFRDLARPLVFHRIIIRVGVWKVEEDEHIFYNDVQLTERRAVRNKEMLQYIARDTEFARIVKAVHVRAHCEWGEETQLDIALVIHALEALPHLRSFRWHGISPALTPAVLDALTKTCGTTLNELTIVSMPSDDGGPRYLAQFKNLQALSLAGNLCDFFHYGEPGPELFVKSCVQHVPAAVLYLRVFGDVVWDTPPRVLSGLYELSLQNAESIGKLEVVFRNCSQLRTLNILTWSPTSAAQALSALQAAPDALPYLTSFKFICSHEMADVNPDVLLAFFKNKPGMRRLDLRLNSPFEGLDIYTQFLDIFAGLPKLAAVGLMVNVLTFTREHLRLLDERLPLGLSALLLSWESHPADDTVQKEDWIAMLKRRPSLAYFHALVDEFDLCELLLKDHPPALELVGYGSCLSSLEHDPATGDAAYGPMWDDETVGFRAVEDFGCEDWEWLLRSHDWASLHSLKPYDYAKECWRHVFC